MLTANPLVAVRKNDKSPAGEARRGIQVIARAASVLRALEGEEGGLSLAQIAQRVELARSTVQRIVEALSAEQLLIAAGPMAKVRLGPALLRLASSASLEVSQLAQPTLLALSKDLGETVDLSVLKGGAAVFIDQLPGSHRLRAVSAVGEAFPLHCTASGKALLSLLPDEKVQQLLRGKLTRFTPQSLVNVADVMEEVALCRRRGFALDNEEHSEGISAVGTGFLDSSSRPNAVSIPVPTARFKRRKSELTEQLMVARTRILAALGSDGT